MRVWLKCLSVLAVGVLAACQSVPAPNVTSTSGAKAIILLGSRDANTKLTTDRTYFSQTKSDQDDGKALRKAATEVLPKAFQAHAFDQRLNGANIIVRVMGSAYYARFEDTLKIGCGIDVLALDGVPLGNFTHRYDASKGFMMQDAIDPAYAHCLSEATNKMLASNALKSTYQPDPRAVEQFLRAQGL